MISVTSRVKSEPTRRRHHPLLATDGETALEDMVLESMNVLFVTEQMFCLPTILMLVWPSSYVAWG